MHTSVGIKLSEIMSMEYFNQLTILGGQRGLDNYISKVNVMEVPDIINWVRPGEFLLTTAYSIRDDIDKLNDLIPTMKEIGVSGLGIKTKRYVDSLPESVLQTANAYDFPLVSIPIDMSFGDIISNVLTSVVNKQMDLLVQIDEFNTRLKEIMLRGGELEDIGKMIQSIVHAPVAIVEEIFKDYVILTDQYEDQFTSIVEKLIKRQTFKMKYLKGDSGIEADQDIIRNQTVKRMMIPIYSDGVSYGYVIIWDIDENIPERALMIIEAATSLIALYSSKKLSIYENENKHKVDFIEELLSSDESQQARAAEKAAYFNFNLSDSYGVLMVSLDKAYTDLVRTPNNTEMLKQLNSKLISVVERVHRFYKGKMIYANKSDRVVFLIGFDKENDEITMKKAMSSLGSELLDFARLENLNKKISLGLGRVYRDYRYLHKSYREAQRAIHQLSLKGNKHMMHFDDLGIYRILSNAEVLPDIKQFFIEVLGPIVLYDREKDAELLATLKMYYACGQNLKKVSEELFTHYNTIIYRMQRIKEIGNIDFSNPDESLNVHMALKMLDVISIDQLDFDN
ncbi:hypothetical protein EZV73_09425 [Acidaminobacter sp. JC074]|uniref:PucR family transcriptional regulator n=1 Tax=Acidaminobacter sp. JC074 TaxID=2530199 RepID=UPI001F0E8081|nr:PucR family transcriptional regulator [Acidaminobacter sp. JC074]MCH4887794.1 hypothetical protein [Acidaminobacter sp. JC074]